MDYPRPKWKPTVVEDLDSIVEKAAEYTDDLRAFIVFSWGTVVYSDSSLHYTDGVYLSTLMRVVRSSPDFNVIPMNDGNFSVLFAGSATGIVLRSFFVAHSDEIFKCVYEGGRFDSEYLASANGDLPHDDTEMHLAIGLYARAKLYQDAAEQVIARRYCPSRKSDP